MSEEYAVKKIKKIVIIGVASLFLVITLFNSFSIIPTGYTGVRTTFGQVSKNTVPTGINWKIPYVQSISKVNNKQQDLTVDGKIYSETQARTTTIIEGVTVSYTINSDRSSWIYSHISDYKNNLISAGLVSSAVKSSSKTLSDVDVTNRNKIEPLIGESLQKSLDNKYGESTIKVNKIIVNNIDFEETYNQSIAAKQNAQLAYEKQQIENQKNIEQAKAEAEAAKAKAQGVADAAIIEAEGKAQANKKLQESLSNEVLKNNLYEKWNGELPKVSGSSNMIISSDMLDENKK